MKKIYFVIIICLNFCDALSNVVPTASISGGTTVCENASGVLTTFTGSGGTAPYIFTYTINGVTQPTISTTAGNSSITLTVLTGISGTFTYGLVSVQDSTNATEAVTSSTTFIVSTPPTVSFTFVNDNSCSGTNMQFTSNVVGSESYTYSWNFGDSTALSTQINPSHSFNSLGCGTANFTVTLTVTGGGCTVSTTRVVNVKQKPDIKFNDPNALNGSQSSQFSNCSVASISNITYSITVQNISPSVGCVTSYSINWGDTTSQTNVIFPLSHTYTQLGVYSMVITSIGNFGCSNSVTYDVKNISNPSGGVLNPGGTVDMCIPSPAIQYTIGNWAQNSPGTTYAINYGDNSPILNLSQATMVASPYYNLINPLLSANYPVPYSYTTNSCPGGDFTITLVVTNACRSTTGTVVGGNTKSKPIANFTAPQIGCSTSNVLFTNNTILGYDSGGGGCIRDTKFIWNFGDPVSGASNIISTGWVTNISNVNHTFSAPGTYTVTLTAQNGCGITTKTQQICIEPPLIPLFTLNTTSGCIPLSITATNNTVLTNQCSTPTYLWRVTYTAANCGTSITAIPDQTAANATFNFTEAGNYAIKLTVTNSCGSVASTQTVIVKKPPTVSIAAINNYCGTATINPLATVPACVQPTSSLTYSWSFAGGNPATSTSANPGNIVYSTTGNYTVSLIVSNECGASNTAIQTFNVNQSPVITNSSLSQTICSGTATTLVNLAANPSTATFLWTATATAGVSGFTASGTNTIPIQTIATTASSVGTVTYVITPAIGSCLGTIVNYVVNVNPAAQVNQPTSVSVCNGSTTAAINFTTNNPSGTTFSWTNSTPSIGLAPSGNGIIPAFTAVNTTNAPIIATIIVTPSFSGGSAVCSGVAKTFTITVNPTGQANQPNSIIKCNGDSVPVTFSTLNTGGTTTYNWANDTPSIGLPATGTGNISFTATNSTNNPLVASIVVTPTYNNGSSNCAGTPVTFTITINPSAQVNQPTAISVCNANSVPTTTFTTLNTSGTTSYTWTNSNATIGLNASGSGDIASFTAINNGNSVINAIITVTPSYLIGTNSCSGSTKQFTIAVSPNANVNTIQNKVVCNGSNLPSIIFASANTGGTTSYNWTNSNAAIGLSLSGTGNIPSFTATNTGLFPITATISVTPSFLNGSLVCAGTTQAFTITVNPSAQVNSINNVEVCNGNNIASTVFLTNNSGGTTTYSWTNSNINIGLAANGNGNIAAFTANNTSLGPITATITVIATYTNAGVSCFGVNQTFTIKVNPSPTGTISGTTGVCLNASNPLITFTGSAGNSPYIFTYNINNGANQTIITTSGNSISINAATSTLGIFTYNLVNVQDSNATSCLNTISQSAIITVNTAPSIDIPPTPTQSICVGGTILNPLSVHFVNGTGNPTYKWYSNSTNTTTGGTLVGTNSPNYTPPVFNTPGTFYYYVIISFSGSGCGNITSTTAEISVVNDPIVSTQPLANQTLCQNAPATALTLVASGGLGIYSYQWYRNVANNASGGTIIGGATTDTFMPITTTAGTLYYYCEITQPTAVGCNVNSQISSVNVNIAPTILGNLTSSTVCLGQTATQLTVAYSNGVGTPSYQWYSNTANSNASGTIIANEIGATFNPPSTVVGTVYYFCIIRFASLNGGCEILTSNTATVNINQVPVISNQNTTICSNATFLITPANSSINIAPSGTVYTWSTPTITPIGSITGASAQGLPQTSINQTLINTTTAPATVTYIVTPKTGSCIGATFTVAVTVNPATNPNAIKTDISCFGINNGSITTTITGGILPYSISWTGPNSFTSSATNISGLFPGIYNLSIIDAGGCPILNSYTINEPSDIIITTNTNNNVTCFGSNNGAIAISVTGGTGAYTYSWTKNSLPYAITDDISNLSPATYVVSVSDANNCGPKIASFIITEPPILSVNLVSQTNVNCYGFATGVITINATGGTPIQTSLGVLVYSYSWTSSNGFTSSNQNISNLIAGTYNLTVTDNLGCSKNLVVTITQSSEIIINATTTPIVCYGANNATINVALSGGQAPYQVQWSNLAVGLSQNNLAPGNYIITVTDNVGCQKVLSISIPSPPVFTVNPIVTNISCFGAHDGSILLNFVGGIAPVNLVWSDGSPAGITRNNLGAGTYSVIITDAKPCTISRTFIILEPQPIVLSANTTNALNCNNANTGAINLLVSGGTPPFLYLWNNSTTTEDLANIPAGNYAVTVTDARGCTKTAQYSITRPNPLILSVNTLTNANCNTRTVTQIFTAQPNGGVPPYQINWSSGTVTGANNEFMTTMQNGLVTVTATDAIGCTNSYSLNVAMPLLGNPTFLPSSIGYTSYGIYSILDPIQFNSISTGNYSSIFWDFGDGTFSNELNPIHIYSSPNNYVVTQTVTYPFGCVYSQFITLKVEKGYLLVVPTAFTPNNDGVNDTYRSVNKGLKNVRIDIYDTWGSLIYSEIGDVLVGWNGKIKDVYSENGNYYAVISGETFYGTIINENQTFVLIK
ncbi:MAG: PKD domain-containing protein [Flavobacterium sp.]|nr:PKD domain-containing protein [Flavobacterium sp.]